VTGRRGRRRRKPLDDLKERRGYCHLEEEALIALCGELALEEALDLSQNKLLNGHIYIYIYKAVPLQYRRDPEGSKNKGSQIS